MTRRSGSPTRPPRGNGQRHPARRDMLAVMASHIASGIEANVDVDLDQNGVAERAVSVAEAILARIEGGLS